MKSKGLINSLVWIFLLFSFDSISQVSRQPYLQISTPTSIVIRWQTDTATVGIIYYDTVKASLTNTIKEIKKRPDHELKLTGLKANTKYYFSVEYPLKATDDQYFITAPGKGSDSPVRIWVISDFGQTNSRDNTRRLETVDQWKSFNNNNYHANFVLSLGDQTEDDSASQLQDNYFDQLENVLKNSPLYTVVGNHDNHDSLTNYLKTFTLPAGAEAGGIASHNKMYYSFDYANIHVVVLSTEIYDDVSYNAQVEWLKKDLAHNKQTWLIACMHQPFHSGGYHPTDENKSAQKRRKDWLTALEDNGIDLILQGHNHVYERSFMVDNLIGKSTSIIGANKIDTGSGRQDVDGAYRKPAGNKPHKGTVFISCTGGGVANSIKHYPAPFNIYPIAFPGSEYEGPLVIDVNKNQMDVKFLCNEKNKHGSHIWDYFTIIKGN
jgi:acid phosphatase type 7